LPCGISHERFFRLCVRAPRITMASFKGKAPRKIFGQRHSPLREPGGATVHFHYKLRCNPAGQTLANMA
jgi:hypothetical protein